MSTYFQLARPNAHYLLLSLKIQEVNFIKKIIGILSLPLQYPGLTAMLVAMGCAVNGILMYVNIHAWIPPVSLILQFTRAVVLVWILVIVYALSSSWQKTAARVFMSVVILSLSVNYSLDLFVHTTYHVPFTYDFLVAIVDATRIEAADFLITYFNREVILYLLCCILGFIGIYAIFTRLKLKLSIIVENFPIVSGILLSLFLSICMAVNINYCHVMGANTDITAKIISASRYKPSQKITATLPSIKIDSASNPPKRIVIVVGESHNKEHSQLYGYGKNTQPRLMEMAADSAIVVFNNAKTSASYTVGTFKEIIGTWSYSLPNDSLWYRCPTFFQIAKAAGFYTSWISNQSRVGLGDSPISVMSELADADLWTNDGIKYTVNYDEKILPLLDKTFEKEKNLDFIHLLGSHMMYNERFPQERTKFQTSDYLEYPSWQRKNIADYDNSVLYNDSVLAQIFKHYKKYDALVIYFSDHGEDLYQSSDGFYGHGQPRESKSYFITERVPFIVFFSDECRRNHPELIKRIIQSKDNQINTTNLTYTIMDLLGVDMQGWPKAASHSFFNLK